MLNNLAFLDELLRGDDVSGVVVVLGIVGKQDPEAVADGEPVGDKENLIGESAVAGAGKFIEDLPGNEHRHDDRLAAAGGHFEGDAIQVWVVCGGRVAQIVVDPGIAEARGDFGEIDGGFEGFDLAEEKFALALCVVPVGEEASGSGCDPR